MLLAYDVEAGIRHAQVRKQRTRRDFAECIHQLITEQYAAAERVEILLDNLNTPTYGSFYEHLALEEAELLRRKVKFVYTPKHGSWLNMTEIEFSAIARQCLANRRIGSLDQLNTEIQAWVEQRNAQRVRINWTFITTKAREKFWGHYAKLRVQSDETSGIAT